MDGWIGGLADGGCLDGWMAEWMDGRMYRWIGS